MVATVEYVSGADLLCHWTWVLKEAVKLGEMFQLMLVVSALSDMDHFMEVYLVSCAKSFIEFLLYKNIHVGVCICIFHGGYRL